MYALSSWNRFPMAIKPGPKSYNFPSITTLNAKKGSVFFIHSSKGWTWDLKLWAQEELLSHPAALTVQGLQQSYGKTHQRYFMALSSSCHCLLWHTAQMPSSPDLANDDGIKTGTCTYSRLHSLTCTHTNAHKQAHTHTDCRTASRW